MGRIVLLVIRRQKALFIGGAILFICQWANALAFPGDHALSRLALFSALLFECILANGVRTWFDSPEAKLLLTLPLSRRQFGAAAWFVAVAAPAMMVVVAKALGAIWALSLRSRPPVEAPWLAFSMACDVAYTGTLGFLWTTHAGSLTGLRRIIVVTGFAAFTALGWLVIGVYLPTTWADVTVWHQLLLALGLVLTATGYVRSARLGSDRGTSPVRSLATATASSAQVARGAFVGRLSGVRLAAWHQFGMAAVVMTTVLVALFTLLWIRWHFHEPWNPTPLVQFVDFRVQNPMIWILFFLMNALRPNTALRSLRALPLSTKELNLFVTMRPVITWVAMSLVLSVTFALLTRQPPSLMGLCAFSGALGIVSILNSLTLRWQPHASLLAIVAWLFMRFAFDLALSSSRGLITYSGLHIAWATVGLVGLLVSIAWNQWLLTSSAATYRAVSQTRKTEPG